MAFESKSRRDAWATVAGFIFQVNTTIVRWLNLQDGEVLELERGEDIDIVQTEFSDGVINVDRVLEQTKEDERCLNPEKPRSTGVYRELRRASQR
jgi:hypothetical protein